MENIKIVKKPINLVELKKNAEKYYGDMVKAVVDVEREILAVGGEFHVDMQTILANEENSSGASTWGINLYFDKTGDDFIEFDSMVNLKPALGNKTRNVENPEIQEKIRNIVNKLVVK